MVLKKAPSNLMMGAQSCGHCSTWGLLSGPDPSGQAKELLPRRASYLGFCQAINYLLLIKSKLNLSRGALSER